MVDVHPHFLSARSDFVMTYEKIFLPFLLEILGTPEKKAKVGSKFIFSIILIHSKCARADFNKRATCLLPHSIM